MKNDCDTITSSSIGDNHTRVLLKGQLIVRNGNIIKNGLMHALDSSPNLEVVFRNIVKIDLAILQLLIALQKSAAMLEKTLLFDIEVSEDIQMVIHNAGLENIFITNFKSQVNGIQ